MSESEKFEAQGRAHARLKQLRSEASTITVELTRRAGEMSDLAIALRMFATSTDGRPVSSVNPAEILHRQLREFDVAGAGALVVDLFRIRGEIRLLEEQIQNF